MKIIFSKTYFRISKIFGMLPFFYPLYKTALLFFLNSLRVKNQVFASIYRLIQKSLKYFFKYLDAHSNIQKTASKNLLSSPKYPIFLLKGGCKSWPFPQKKFFSKKIIFRGKIMRKIDCAHRRKLKMLP